jgi:hypothetical protein
LVKPDIGHALGLVGVSGTRSGLDGAAVLITTAARELEELGEAEEWSVAHQKLALAYRGAGDLGRAQRLIAVARDSGADDTPLRLAAVQAHILLTDPATRAEGLTLPDGAASLAAASGL